MEPHRHIDDYLAELAALLPGPTRWRSRANDEIRDHLLCEYESQLAAGREPASAAEVARTRVGAPRTVAAAFAGTRARVAVTRAERVSLACGLGLVVLVALTNPAAAARVSGPLSAGAPDVVGWFAAQLAIVAGVVVWLRGRGSRGRDREQAAGLALSLRAMAVVVGGAGLVVAVDVLALLTGPGSPATGIGLNVAIGALAGGALLALITIAIAAEDVRALRELRADDVGATSALEELRRLADRAKRSWAERTLTWVLGHRAGTAMAVGAGAGAVLAGASLREHGLSSSGQDALLALLAALVQFVIEGGAVVLGIYAFDRVLRLWPHGDGSRELGRVG